MIESVSIQEEIDAQTIETLEKSLIVQILKLFAIMAKADQVVSEEERQFVAEYCDQYYPRKIANYLYIRFEEYINTDLDFNDVADDINDLLSYKEKFFCLLKTYELIVADEAEERELHLVHKIAQLIDITEPDLHFVESVFGLRSLSEGTRSNTAIVQIKVTDNRENSDVWLPFSDLHLEIYKIYGLYGIIQRDTGNAVMIDEMKLRPGRFTRIPHNADILINDYIMKYQDLKVYFEGKIHPLTADLYLSFHGESFSWDRYENEYSALQLVLEGSHIQLRTLGGSMDCEINGREKCTQDAINLNLSDEVKIFHHRLNIREVFFHLNREKIIPLNSDKEVYEITNDARGDVFIAGDLAEKWTVKIARNNQGYVLNKGDCPFQIRINGKSLARNRNLTEGDTIFINNRFLEFHFNEHYVKQTFFSFEKLAAKAVSYAFNDGTTGLDDVSFEVNYGDLVCIMGPSGCGKSTLLNLISGFNPPKNGVIRLGEHNLHQDYTVVKDYLGYVPQDDLLLGNLTVYENLYYYAKLRFPNRTRQELDPQIDLVLRDVGLYEKRNTRVGTPVDKTLSGGQRKRLNIGLELLANAEVYLLDEPTSGLSSKDSENIVELLTNIAARGKIVMAVIHQPSSRLYKMFNKIILLDKGGHVAYFGQTYSALSYFLQHKDVHASGNGSAIECPYCKTVQPDLLLDILEESLRDVDGQRLSERKYSPLYWKEQFKNYKKGKEQVEAVLPELNDLPPSQILTFTDRLNQLRTLLSRNFRSKFRDRSNLIITFLGAPFLGWGVGWVTKFAPNDQYSLYANDLYQTFLFTAVICAMFFGMTNSVDEIINDRAIFLRERMLSLQNRSYLIAKFLILALFAFIQNALYVGLGFWVLEVRELYLFHVFFLSTVSLAGISLGLLISSIPNISSKAAQNFVPLLLIPQIVLGGALIVYEDMNRELRFFKESPIPEICQFMPSRWAYEGVMVMQATYNSFDRQYDQLGVRMNELKRQRPKLSKRKDEIVAQQGEDYYRQQKKALQKQIDEIEIQRDNFMIDHGLKYGNSSIHSKVAMADAAFNKNTTAFYKMLVSRKVLPFINHETSTVVYNLLVVLLITAVLLSCTLFMLRFRENVLKTAAILRRYGRKTASALKGQ